jgi:hypothetical protein
MQPGMYLDTRHFPAQYIDDMLVLYCVVLRMAADHTGLMHCIFMAFKW